MEKLSLGMDKVFFLVFFLAFEFLLGKKNRRWFCRGIMYDACIYVYITISDILKILSIISCHFFLFIILSAINIVVI